MAIMSVNKVFNTRRLIRVVVAVLVMVNLVYLVRYIGGRQVTDVVKEIIPAHRAADSKNKVTVDKMPETTSPVAENKKEVLVNDVFDDMVTFSPLDPQQVTSCKVDNNLRQIPHIIHQSWKTNTLPFRFLSWQKTWISKHPDWEYRLWTDADNLQLVEEHFPWFLETYKALPQNIHRADAVRYMYMYKFGGFYSDLDLEALKDHSGLANCGGLLVPLMSDDFNFVHNVPNAWIASVPNHPFWTFLLKNIQSRFSHDTGGVEGLTGPIMLYDTLKAYSQKPTLEPIKYVRPGKT